MHMTHTGEQGYVLYIPNEFAVEIYDSIMEAGLFSHNFNCIVSLVSKYLFLNKEIQISNTVHSEVVQT